MLKALQILSPPLATCSCRYHHQLPTGATIEIGGLLSFTRFNPKFITSSTPISFTHWKTFTAHSSPPIMDGNPNSPQPTSVQHAKSIFKVKFCQWCGGKTKHEIPDGEEKIRAICTLCGQITYQNPKMVVGCLIEHEGNILLCKRNIEPSFGLWTLPAGFLEIGESTMEGAVRETWEEAQAEVEIISPFAQLDIPLISQTYIIFLARLTKHTFSPGPESSATSLFPLDGIPFDSLAFSSILATLKLYVDDVKKGLVKYHYGTINKRPGSSPSDIHAYTLDNHLES